MQITRRQFLVSSAAAAVALGAGYHSRAEEGAFTFATVGDIHVTDEASVALLRRAVAQINADTRVRFTAVLGDIATLGRAEELALAKGALDALARPYYAVPGNHDVNPYTPDLFDNYRAAFGETHWVREENGWSFIGVNSCEAALSDVTVSGEELAWLDAQLPGIPEDRPVALFCHHPLNPNTRAYRIKNAEDILARFAGHKLRVAAAGHWHGNQEETRGGVLFTTTACCTSTRNNFDDTPEKGYRLFHLAGDSVTTEFVEVR
jgi:3',5'-cyclic AMP phosphodiesterase CpdA